MWPYVDSLVKRHVRQQPIPLDEQIITLKSGLTFRVAGIVYFRVTDVYKALFDIDNLDLSVKELAMGLVRDIVAKHEDQADLADTAVIAAEILKLIEQRTATWGTQIEDFRITVCAPTPESAVIVNLEAAARKKTESIKAAAEALEVSLEDIVETGLAAVIAGVPLVSSANTAVGRKRRKLPEREETSSFALR